MADPAQAVERPGLRAVGRTERQPVRAPPPVGRPQARGPDLRVQGSGRRRRRRFEQRSELIEAFRRLPARQREVLALRYVDMSVADAAATLHISQGAVRSTASRGLDALARILSSRSSKEA